MYSGSVSACHTRPEFNSHLALAFIVQVLLKAGNVSSSYISLDIHCIKNWPCGEWLSHPVVA